MNADLLAKIKFGLKFAAALARYTDTKLDDQTVAFLVVEIDNPFIQSLIGHAIDIISRHPQYDAKAVIDSLPPGVYAAANNSVAGKFGDGKFLALLIRLLPLILAL